METANIELNVPECTALAPSPNRDSAQILSDVPEDEHKGITRSVRTKLDAMEADLFE